MRHSVAIHLAEGLPDDSVVRISPKASRAAWRDSFTGSTATGKLIQKAVSERRVLAEIGRLEKILSPRDPATLVELLRRIVTRLE
jgi:hypothetical protein